MGALARHDLASSSSASKFEFRLLAASTGDLPEVAGLDLVDTSHRMRLRARVADQRIVVSLQAEGYAALFAVRGRKAHLASQSGTIMIRLGFDTTGAARCDLRDDPEVRQALQHLILLMEGETPL